MSDFETCDSLQPCEVCEGRRYWFSGLQWNCCKCKPQPLDCMITFEVGKLAWCTPSPPEPPLDLEQHRARLRKMDDYQLRRHGEGCAHARSGDGDARRKHF